MAASVCCVTLLPYSSITRGCAGRGRQNLWLRKGCSAACPGPAARAQQHRCRHRRMQERVARALALPMARAESMWLWIHWRMKSWPSGPVRFQLSVQWEREAGQGSNKGLHGGAKVDRWHGARGHVHECRAGRARSQRTAPCSMPARKRPGLDAFCALHAGQVTRGPAPPPLGETCAPTWPDVDAACRAGWGAQAGFVVRAGAASMHSA